MSCRYCPAGVQGTVLGFAVDLSVLLYLLRPFSGPHRAGVPGRLVLVDSDCASRRRAVSRCSVYPRLETQVEVGSEAFRLERRAGVESVVGQAFRLESVIP